MIKPETIEKVLDAANIVDVVSEFVTLKKAGVNMKGLCPFHEDTTPSFMVSPAKNLCKCFACGEGGSPVGFIMKHEGLSYPEAIKFLGKKYGIEIDESVPTATELKESKMRESMWIANGIMAQEYHNQLLSHEEARNYAYKRWGEEHCKFIGIGYCPSYSRLVEKNGINEEVAKELHLKGDKGYDVFGGRITIPIRDRNQHIIGFTARAFDKSKSGDKEPPKYVNSTENAIYNKSKSMFGMYEAWNHARKEDKFYLVEGAPDCMRLHIIGVMNTVAPLGTALTEEQLNTMKRVAKHICFLPDADPPKENGDLGPGIQAVMKSGELAMRKGFSVSVKQIPVTEEKQDPDTYCRTKEIFDGIEEQEYILWLAEQLYVPDMTIAQKGKFIEQITNLLALIEDETAVEMYIGQLVKYTGNKSLWRKKVENHRKQAAEEEENAKAERESALYKQFGFNVIENKYYYSISDNGGSYVWSNFVMEPLFHIKDSVNPKRIYRLRNMFGHEDLIEMKQEDLVSIAKFKQRIEGLGNFIWKATEKELTKLKSFLYEKTETAVMINQLGWQRQGFFAFGNGIFYDGKFIPVDDYGIVRIEEKGNFYLPANSQIYRDDIKLFQFERRFVHIDFSSVQLNEFSEQIFRVFGDNGRVGFIFFLATLFRDVVTRSTRSFPILNLFGPKGSGKSELGHTLMSFFIVENIPPNIQNSTLPALNDTVAAVANALVHIDEYKNNMDINKIEFLKGLWDGTGRTRMNMDLDKKKETTSVDSGIILSGQEMPTADIALFSRLIFLSFSKSTFTAEEKRDYQVLKKMRSQGMSHLTLEILMLRNIVEADFPLIYQKTLSDVNEALENELVEDRIMLNWVSPLAVLRCIETKINTSLSYKQMQEICVKGIRYQNSQCKQSNELAAFWEIVQYLTSEGEIHEGGDFRIEYLRRLKTDKVKVNWLETRPVLYVQKSRIFMLYKKNGKAVGDTLLPERSLKYYLENSREYLGEKPGVRYKKYNHGMIEPDRKDPSKEASVVQRSYCFDYNMLADTYGINLEQATDKDGDTAREEDELAEHPIQQELNLS